MLKTAMAAIAVTFASATPCPTIADTVYKSDRIAVIAGIKQAKAEETAAAVEPRLFALATIYEDVFFAGDPIGADAVVSYVAHGMTPHACIRASRLLNNYGGMTVCLPE